MDTADLPSTSLWRPISPGFPTAPGAHIDTDLWTGIEPFIGPQTSPVRMPTFSISDATPARHSVQRVEDGSYIAFAVDDDMIAESELADSVLASPLGALGPRRYVGLVEQSCLYNVDGKWIEVLDVYFVCHGPPPVAGAENHYLLIGPFNRHISPETALETEQMVPWVDCVQCATLGIRLVVESFHESGLKFKLRDESFSMFEKQAAKHLVDLKNTLANGLQSEETNNTRKLMLSDYAVPATIWRDVRFPDQKDVPSHGDNFLYMGTERIESKDEEHDECPE
ncbi:hypothetical protein BKA93DRAFT_786123 [Sparassis latifolia]